MWQRLREVAEVSTGYPFRGKVYPEDQGDVAVVQIKDVDAELGLKLDDALLIRSDGGRYDKYLLSIGDVLFQSRGSRHPVAVVETPVKGIAALGLHVLRPQQKLVRPAYLAWYLNHPNTQAQLKDNARGSYVPFIAKSDLEEFSAPIPPVAVQDRIVEVDRLWRLELQLKQRLDHLRERHVNAVTWQAAISKSKGQSHG